MSLIIWSNSYSVGVPSIDEQHKKLIDIINNLSDGIKSGKAHDATGYALADLINYTEQHFKYEEDLLEKADYPLSESHVEEHESLKEKLYEIKTRFESSADPTLSTDVTNFLCDWLLGHIQESDMKYSNHLMSCGVK